MFFTKVAMILLFKGSKIVTNNNALQLEKILSNKTLQLIVEDINDHT